MKTPYTILKDTDISETQVYLTIHTFEQQAKEYAEKWEWNQKTIKEIKKYNIRPFLKVAKKRGVCLVAGCQTGRDYSLLTENGMRCIGVSPSYGLLQEALKRVDDGIFIQSDLRELPFLPNSYDSVYADALTSVPKSAVRNVLKDFHIFLKPGGILYLSVKLGKGVLLMEDLGGPRFLTLFERKEIISMLKNLKMDIVWSKLSSHTDSNLPNWFSLIAKKSE